MYFFHSPFVSHFLAALSPTRLITFHTRLSIFGLLQTFPQLFPIILLTFSTRCPSLPVSLLAYFPHFLSLFCFVCIKLFSKLISICHRNSSHSHLNLAILSIVAYPVRISQLLSTFFTPLSPSSTEL